MTRPPLIDRAVAHAAGKALTWLGKRAHARGDTHELEHLRAAVIAGNSSHTDDWPCALPHMRDALQPSLDRRAKTR